MAPPVGGSLSQRTPAPDEATGSAALYETDFVRWARQEADLIRAGRFGETDRANLVEEIESLGREPYDKLRSHTRVILLHVLKWDHQPGRRTRSWSLSVRDARNSIESTLESSPSLKRRRQGAIDRACDGARMRAALETDLLLSSFPPECPCTLGDMLDRPVLWPDD